MPTINHTQEADNSSAPHSDWIDQKIFSDSKISTEEQQKICDYKTKIASFNKSRRGSNEYYGVADVTFIYWRANTKNMKKNFRILTVR